jgi:hypothetical protein
LARLSRNTQPESGASVNWERRKALKTMGGLAAYVAPAMTVLVQGKEVSAHHRPGHNDPCKNFPDSPYCLSAF